MAINKVVINTTNGEETLIDLTGDTVTPETLAKGTTAHSANGETIYGAMPLISVVQEAGQSETSVMSQKAVTSYVNDEVSELERTKLSISELNSTIDSALTRAKESGEFDGAKGDKGDKGDTGQRGTGLLPVTTAPSSYTTAVGGITPKYRMALSTIKTQSGATEVLLGDTVRYSYYHYPIAYLDASYAYFTTRQSIRGATGAAGTTPVKGTDYWTESDKQEMVNELGDNIIIQEAGQSESLVMSQKAVTDMVADLPNNETLINNVVDKVGVVKVAEQPEFANDISECTDTSKMYVLPNGHLCAYMSSEVTTEGETTPNFTNLYDTSKGAYIKDGQRYSASSAAFKAATGLCSVYIPIQTEWICNVPFTLRIRGAQIPTVSYWNNVYVLANNDSGYTGGALTNANVGGTYTTESNGDLVINMTANKNDAVGKFHTVIFNVLEGSVDESNFIVTFNEEITYTIIEGGTETVAEWVDTGIEYNQPADYGERVNAVEKKTAKLETDVNVLEHKVNNMSSGTSVNSGGIDAFVFSAYPPTPQLPADGSDEADFNTDNVATSEVYAYMDDLWSRYRTYMVKQNLGKDSSGEYDYYRYVFSKAYWRAWFKENYPKMYAWKNGSTVIYSESVSPRIGDTMYSTPYIGTTYNTVTAVNSETVGVASTRTVNGLVFTRYADGDVEPTIVYTTPFAITANYKGRTYTSTFAASSSVKEFTHEYIVDNNNVKYYRYPFEDRKLDKSRLFSVFILANEHGNHGDSMIPCVTVMRMLKDLCGNTNIPFLRWLKENAVVTVIPLGNPHGSYRNANGVNINRNYDTPGWAGSDTDPQGGTLANGQFGAYAGSEIETQYIMNTMQQCKAQAAVSYHGRGIPTGTLLGEYNSAARFQGCGFDAERMWKVEEALFTMYNFGFTPSWHTIEDETHNNYLNAGKSPSYIEYVGAVGGLIEIDDFEVGTLNCFTPLAMEQAYAEVLLVLQNWCEEALIKSSN